MIDLHNHILPGIDDGARDPDESLDIARQFVQEGVVRVAATPHVDALHGTGPSKSEVEEGVRVLRGTLARKGVELAVETGCELYLTPDAPSWLQSGKATPLGRTKAILIECSFYDRPLYLEDTIFQLQLMGYQPVLAHPERYAFVQRDISVLQGLIERDVLLQLTAPSLLGEYGNRVRRTAQRLLRLGMYAVAASDRHHPGPARSLAALHERIARSTEPDVADLLLRRNPSAILAGKAVLRPDVQPAETSSLFGRWLRRR